MMYAELDKNQNIIAGWSGTVQPWRLAITPNPVLIGDFGGDAFRLAEYGEDDPNLFDWEYGVPIYRWDGEQVVRRTREEITADIAALPVYEPEPTADEILNAMLGVTE